MKTKNKKELAGAENEIDAVRFMREQRILLSKKLSKMTRKEIVEYFQKKQIGSVKPQG